MLFCALMKHFCSLGWLILLFLLPSAAQAYSHVLTLRAIVEPRPNTNAAAFVDQVEIIDAATGTVVAGAVLNAGFETPAGADWAFPNPSGIVANGSTLANPNAPEGTHVAFLQTSSTSAASISQSLLALAGGTFRVRMQMAQSTNFRVGTQGVEVLVDGVVLGSYVPASDGAFHSYTTGSAFAVPPASIYEYAFAPASGRAGTVVTMTGPVLAGATAVTVNGVAGTILRNTPTSLTFAVGAGSTTGLVAVSTPAGTASSSTSFVVGRPMPNCFEEVDTVSTPANGGYSLLMGTDPPTYPPAANATPGRCDDCAQRIDLGFGFEMFGTVYTSCYINSNGTVSFQRPVYDFTGYTFPTYPRPMYLSQTPFPPMLSPFWADICNASTASGRIWYKLYPDRLVVLWSRVGYLVNDNNALAAPDKKNTFQLILRRNTVAPAPANDVTFAYGEIQWIKNPEVFGSTQYASVGFDAADQTHYFNALGNMSTQLLTSLPGACMSFTVGSRPEAVARTLAETGITAIGPNPVGLGQEVTLTGPSLAGTSSAAVNGADATPSLSRNTATSLTLRRPAAATLAGVTSLTTAAGTAVTGSLNGLPEPGNALAFDGSDDYVSVPHAAAIDLASALTVEAWVRTSATTAQYLVAKSDDSFYLAVNGGGGGSGKASFLLKGPSAGAWLYGTSTLSDGHWHHLAGTYDGAALNLYVDGKLENSRPATGAVATGTAPLLLGGGPSKPYLNGSLDEVRLWRTARSAAELLAGLYQVPRLPAADLVAYFNFDRGTPSGANGAFPTFLDAAGGLLATLNNLALTGSTSNFVESYALVVPAGLSATALAPTSFTLSWQTPVRGSVGSLVLDVSTSATFATATTYTLASTATSQAVTGRVANTAYYYRLRADRIYGVTGQGAYVSGSLTTPTTAAACTVSISGISPASGSIGSTVVTVSGVNFAAGRITAVTFGGVATTSFTVVNASTLQVTVPAGAVTGRIGLVTTCGTTVSASDFTMNAPTLTQVSPAAELPGQSVTLTGTGFLPSSTVSFGSQPAVVTYVSPTQLRAVVPVPAVGYATSTSAAVSTLNGAPAAPLAFSTLAVAVPATYAACTAVPAVAASADNNWHYLLSTEGKVVLAFNTQGRNLGTVGASYLCDLTYPPRRDAHGQYYLERNWRLTTSAGPFAGSSVLVRYYGLTREFNNLQIVDPSHAVALGSLRLTQYSGPNEDCTLANNNNTTGTSVLLTPTTTYGPDGSDFFVAEATVPNHFSEFYLAATPTTPLPVELTAFTATAAGPAAVHLAWATASEKNSARFEVERSADGRTFAAIGTVAAAGSSTVPRTYELLDGKLPAVAALLYYRLKQVDQDGTFSYSLVRTVSFTHSPIQPFALFPNPAHGGAATLTGAAPGMVVTVLDALGRPVTSTTADASGTAALVLPAGLPSGVYVVRAGSQALRLVVE